MKGSIASPERSDLHRDRTGMDLETSKLIEDGAKDQLSGMYSPVQRPRCDGCGPSINGMAIQLSKMHPTARRSAALALQSARGNGFLQRLAIQEKLTISQPNDKYEQEADRIADLVMSMPEPKVQDEGVQRSCSECEDEVQRQSEKDDEEIQAKPIAEQITPFVQRQEESEEGEEEEVLAKIDKQGQRLEEPEEENKIAQNKSHRGMGFSIDTGLETQIRSLWGGGQPLSPQMRRFFEPRFGYGFGQVRVHTDPEAAKVARALNSRAFTTGRDVVFGEGQYTPGIIEGQKLLAHELTHVLQNSKREGAILRKKSSLRLENPEILWTHSHKEGYVEKLSPSHFILWNFNVSDSSLKPEFKEILNEIGKQWQILNLAGSGKIVVEGYASSSGSEAFNRRLGHRRAMSVKNYLGQLPENIPWDSIMVKTFGETKPRFPNIGPSLMARNRRVEIKLLNPYSPEPHPEPEPKTRPEPRSNRWKCRIVGSAGGGVTFGGSFFGLEIVDLNNNMRMYYNYLGIGFSGGLSGAGEGSAWKEFKTSIPIRIHDFKGLARHTSAGVQIKRGFSVDYIHLLGPWSVGADSIYLRWTGLWEKGWSLGAGTDMGRLVPVTSPDRVSPGYK